MLVEAVQLALDGIKARATTLTAPTEPGFIDQISGLLAELHRVADDHRQRRGTRHDPLWRFCFRTDDVSTTTSC